MRSVRVAMVVLACSWIGCGKEGGGPNDGFVRMDMVDPCRGPFPPSFCAHDMTVVIGPDMTMPASIAVTGDNASGYTGATLNAFTCITNNPSTGPYVTTAMPDNWPAGNPAHGVAGMTFNIYNDGIQIMGANFMIYYQKTGLTLTTTGKTGTLPSTVLNGASGAPGTLTVGGAWQCP